jgi:hypothetical protein
MLSYLNGIKKNTMRNNAQINGWFDDLINNVSNTINNTVSNITNAGQNVINNAQNFFQNLPKLNLSQIELSNLGNKIKQIGIAPARAGFLIAVRTNFLKLANRLAETARIDQADLKNKWEKGYGGNWNKLKETINKSIKGVPALNGLGAVDLAAIATLITAGIPIIMGMISIIKNKRGQADLADSAGDQAGLDKLAKDALNVNPNEINNLDIPEEFNDSAMPNKALLIGGGVIVAGGLIYFLTRKK